MHGVCAVQSGAASHWDCVAATERSGGSESVAAAAPADQPASAPSQGSRSPRSTVSSAHFGGDPVGRAFASVVEGGRLRAASAPSSFDQIRARVAQRAALRSCTQGAGPT